MDGWKKMASLNIAIIIFFFPTAVSQPTEGKTIPQFRWPSGEVRKKTKNKKTNNQYTEYGSDGADGPPLP